MDNLSQEMKEMKTDILGISEIHWSECVVLKKKNTCVYIQAEKKADME